MAVDNFDSIAPKELIIPIKAITSGAALPTMSGAMFISGAKLYFVLAGVPKEVTST